MEIVDVIISKNSNDTKYWYELLILENKSNDDVNLTSLCLFTSKDQISNNH